MRTKFFLLTLAAIALAPMSALAEAGKTATANATASISIKQKIQITKVSDLAFGEKFTGDVAAEAATPATFTVAGEPSAAFTVTLPAANAIVMKKGAGGTAPTEVVVNSFRHTAGASPALPIGGSMTLSVFGTHATIRNDQQSGAYTASFPVRVDYP